MKATIKNINLICENLDHPECLALDLKGNIITGSESGQIISINTLNKKTEQVNNTKGFILGITIDGKGNIYACDIKYQKIFKCDYNGKIQVYAEGNKDKELINPNFSVFDREGRLFFSDSGNYWKSNGSLWVIEPSSNKILLTSSNLPFPNGLFYDYEESYLYVALSTSASIVKFKIKNNFLEKKMEIVSELPSTFVPDGLALDTSRNIWVGCYAPDVILKINPKGKFMTVMEDSTGELLNRPTNLVLDNNRVYFANLGGWHIGSFETNVEPLKLSYPIF